MGNASLLFYFSSNQRADVLRVHGEDLLGSGVLHLLNRYGLPHHHRDWLAVGKHAEIVLEKRLMKCGW